MGNPSPAITLPPSSSPDIQSDISRPPLTTDSPTHSHGHFVTRNSSGSFGMELDFSSLFSYILFPFFNVLLFLFFLSSSFHSPAFLFFLCSSLFFFFYLLSVCMLLPLSLFRFIYFSFHFFSPLTFPPHVTLFLLFPPFSLFLSARFISLPLLLLPFLSTPSPHLPSLPCPFCFIFQSYLCSRCLRHS